MEIEFETVDAIQRKIAIANMPPSKLTINHEDMTETKIATAIAEYSGELGQTVTDALNRPTSHLVELVFSAYPGLLQKSGVATE